MTCIDPSTRDVHQRDHGQLDDAPSCSHVQVLATNVVPGEISTDQLKEGISAASVGGSEIMGVDDGADGSVMVTGSASPTAKVTDHDIPSCAGPIHVIDRVLLPASISGASDTEVVAEASEGLPSPLPDLEEGYGIPSTGSSEPGSPAVAQTPSPAAHAAPPPAALLSAPSPEATGPAPGTPAVPVASSPSQGQPSSARGGTVPPAVASPSAPVPEAPGPAPGAPAVPVASTPSEVAPSSAPGGALPSAVAAPQPEVRVELAAAPHPKPAAACFMHVFRTATCITTASMIDAGARLVFAGG